MEFIPNNIVSIVYFLLTFVLTNKKKHYLAYYTVSIVGINMANVVTDLYFS